jgi:signal transduction histidine kinase
MGFAQLLAGDTKQPLSEQQRERVDQIIRAGAHLLRLMDSVLDSLRIEAGGTSLVMEPVDPLDAAREAMQELGAVAARSDVRIDLGVLKEQLPLVSANRARLVHIVMKLLLEVIKFSGRGGRVDISVYKPNESHVRIAVKGTGAGSPPPTDDTGVGLVMAKRLAERMGGNVGSSTLPAEGSEVWIELPSDPAGGGSIPRPLSGGMGGSALQPMTDP